MVKRILLAGESWMSYTTHVKGADAFYTSVYETGEKYLKAALEEGGYEFTFLPNHLATEEFPFTMDGLRQYDLIILSDIGANTLLLPTLTFTRSQIQPNRCSLIKNYVLEGGALLMIGGYLTFSGVDAKGKWQDTPVQDVLPVRILPTDDRMEHCEGVRPVKAADHAVLYWATTKPLPNRKQSSRSRLRTTPLSRLANMEKGVLLLLQRIVLLTGPLLGSANGPGTGKSSVIWQNGSRTDKNSV